MNTKQNWWLAGAALLLFVFIVMVERRGSDRVNEPGASTQLIPGMQLDRVTVLEIHEEGREPIRFRKKGLFWMIESPVYYPSTVVHWLQLLQRANWVLRMSPAELDKGKGLAGFGLEPAKKKIVVRQGEESTEIRIGSQIPVGRQVYVQVSGSDDVLVTDETIFAMMPETVDGWRDPALVSYSSQSEMSEKTNKPEIEFGRIEIRPLSQGFAVRRDPMINGWRLTDPIDARADGTMVLSLILSAGGWTVDEYVSDDPNADVVAYGLDKPRLELAFMNGTNDVLSVQFGNSPTNRPDMVYARQVQFTNIVLTARTNMAILQLPYEYWRDRQLIALNTNDVAEIKGEYLFADKTFSYRLESSTNNTWQMMEPESLPVDTELVHEFFAVMNSMRVAAFEKQVVTDFGQYGLAQPARTFSFVGSTNSINTNGYPSLSFGTNANNQAFARRSDEISVYSIDPGYFGVFPLAHWQWRDRNVWSFETNEVRSVSIEQHGRKRELLRTPDGRWLLAPGSSGVVELSLEESVYQFSKLRADRWVAKGGESSAAQFGFSNPPHRVSFEVVQNGVVQTNTITFGGLRDGVDPFASVVLVDGVTWYFDFPRALYYEHVTSNFVLPEGD